MSVFLKNIQRCGHQHQKICCTQNPSLLLVSGSFPCQGFRGMFKKSDIFEFPSLLRLRHGKVLIGSYCCSHHINSYTGPYIYAGVYHFLCWFFMENAILSGRNCSSMAGSRLSKHRDSLIILPGYDYWTALKKLASRSS